MSSIGPGSVSGMNHAGAFAAAQRADRDSDRKISQSAEQQRVQDHAEFNASAVEDVGESTSSHDRDADGRQAFVIRDEQDESEVGDEDENSQAETKPRSKDPDDDKGQLLDLEA